MSVTKTNATEQGISTVQDQMSMYEFFESYGTDYSYDDYLNGKLDWLRKNSYNQAIQEERALRNQNGGELIPYEDIEGIDPQVKKRVDDLAQAIKEEFGNIYKYDPEEAVAAYRMIQMLSPEGIEYFYAKYGEMAYYIDWYLPGEFRKSKGFGFQKGISKEEEQKLKDMLRDESTWQDDALLELVLNLVMDAFVIINDGDSIQETTIGIDPVIELILQEKTPTPAQRTLLESFGFVDGKFQEQPYLPAEMTKVKGYAGIGMKYLGTQREKRKNVISSAGIPFLSGFFNIWQNKNKPELKGFALAQLEEAMGGSTVGIDFEYDRGPDGKPLEASTKGKIDFEADFKEGTAQLQAVNLPFNSIDYQGVDYTFRSGEGVFNDVDLQFKWTTAEDSLEPGELHIEIGCFEMKNLRMTMEEETYAVGSLSISNLSFHLKQFMGKPEDLDNTFGLLFALVGNLTDISSLITYGILQTTYRFTTPSNQEDADGRQNSLDGLTELLVDQFYDEMELSLSFSDLTLLNFVYIDKDGIKNDAGDAVSEGEPDMEFIKQITTGESKLGIKTIGAPKENKEELYRLKKELIDVNAELEDEREKYEKHLTKGHDRRMRKLAKKIAPLEQRADELKEAIFKLQPDQGFEMFFEVNNLGMDNAEMLDKIGSSTLEGIAEKTTGFDKTEVTSLTYYTKFDRKGITDTKVTLNDLYIPKLFLEGLKIASANQFELTGKDVTITNTTAELEVNFANQGEEQYNSEMAALEYQLLEAYGEYDSLMMPSLANKSGRDFNAATNQMAKILGIENAILKKKASFNPGAAEFKDQQQLNDLKHQLTLVNQDIVGLENPPADKFAEPTALKLKRLERDRITGEINALEEKIGLLYNPVENVWIKCLNIESISLNGLHLKLPDQGLQVNFAETEPVTLEAIYVDNLMVINNNGSWETGVGDLSDRASMGLSKLTVPKDLLMSKEGIADDGALHEQLKLKLGSIVAHNASVELLKSGGIDYQVASMDAINGDLTLYDYDEDGNVTEQQSIFNLPNTSPLQDASGKDLPFVSGHYENGVNTFKLHIPEIDMPVLDFGSDQVKFQVRESKNLSKLKGIEVEIEMDNGPTDQLAPYTPKMTIKRMFIDESTFYGMYLYYMKPKDKELLTDKQEYKITFPKNSAVTIDDIELLNYRMEYSPNPDNEGKVEWHYVPGSQNATLTTKGAKLPKGLTVKDLVGFTTMSLKKNATWDSSWFEFLEHGGIAYSFENLDTLLFIEDKDEENKNIDAKALIDLDSKSISGKYWTEMKEDENGIMREYVHLSGAVDIPEIEFHHLFVKGGGVTIKVPDTTEQSKLENIKAQYDVTMKMPTLDEKKAALKKSKDLQEKAKKAKTKKEKRDLLNQAKEKAKTEMFIKLTQLDVDTAILQQPTIYTEGESKILVHKEKKHKYYIEAKTWVELREGEVAVLRQLRMDNFEINVTGKDKQHIQYKGDLSLGTDDKKGIEIGTSHIVSKEVKKLLKNDEKDGWRNTYVNPNFSAQKITFGGDSDALFKLTIVKPEGQMPGDLGSTINKTGIAVDDYLDDNILNFDMDWAKDASGNFPAFTSDEIIVETFEVPEGEKSEENEGKKEYRTRITMVNPNLHNIMLDGGYFIKDINDVVERDDSMMIGFHEVSLNGKVEGNLVIEEGRADLSREAGKENKAPVWEIKAEGTELNLVKGNMSFHTDNLAAHLKEEGKKDPDPNPPTFADNEFGYLDAASGSVKMGMFGKDKSWSIKTFNINGQDIGGYVNMQSIIEDFVAVRFNEELSFGTHAAAVLDELYCKEIDGEYWITAYEGGHNKAYRLLSDTGNNNLYKKDGKEYVRLSAMMNTSVYADPAQEDPTSLISALVTVYIRYKFNFGKDTIEASVKHYIDEWMYRKDNKMNAWFEIDAKVDVAKIPMGNRGQLDFLSVPGDSEPLEVKIHTGFATLNNRDAGWNYAANDGGNIYPTVTISDLTFPAFETKVGKLEGLSTSSGIDTAAGILKSQGMTMEKAQFQYRKHVSPKAGETKRVWAGDELLFDNLSIRGFNLKLYKKPKDEE